MHQDQDRVDTLERVLRTAVEAHYEENGVIDVSTGRICTLSDEEWIRPGPFFKACSGGYDAGITALMERAENEEDRTALSALLLENLLPRLRAAKSTAVCCRLADGDGHFRWKRVDCSFFDRKEEKLLLLVADIQAEEDVKERLRTAAEEALAASRAKSAFLANMSHEIRTPMNAIVGISEVLLRKELPQDVLESLSTIQNSGSSLLGIINDILDFSKIETGKFEITEAEYMLPSLLMDISNVISVRLQSKPVYFMMDIDPSLPNHFVGDDIRIKQILMNLLGNAVKFTHEGYILLWVRGAFTEGENYELRFEVRDSGIGIREEDMGKLFDTFSQVDTRKNRGMTGSGLGLAISRNLARLMSGELTVESDYGKGSVFSVRVMQRVPRYIPLGEVRDKNVRLLICEQNESLVHGLRVAAENLGLKYEICREIDKLREYPGMTHVLIRRRSFEAVQEKLNFMFSRDNILLLLDNDELPDSAYMDYKQLQLPLITLQMINALNGEEIISSIKKKSFDRSQIVPLTFAHVLVVDDNTTNLQVAQGLMSPYRMQIDVSTSGFEAIEMVKKTHYDAIFMDHMMPEMDGIEAARYIRNLDGEYYRTVPIIALTANAMSDARDQFLNAGMDDFVAKPIEMRELHRVIRKYIQSRAPAGYMKKMREEQSASVRKKTAAKPAPKAEAGPVSTSVDGSFARLLEQNNALLEQNMLLLNALLGKPSEKVSAPVNTAAAEPSAASVTAPGQLSADSPEEAESSPATELPDFIHGVDMHRSLETYGGSVEIYHNILKTYCSDIREKEETLPAFFERRDTENFTIQVHALKSASRSVGAFDLGEDAYQLELAGKAGDWKTIETLFPPFRQALHQMVVNVGSYAERYLKDEKETGGSFSETLDAALTAELREACRKMEYLHAEEILKQLRQKRYPEDLGRRLDEMYACCESFDYDRLETMVKELGVEEK
ncbi:MAG: response regulator [Oscillospiraceae bacterium]|nr:response regulator [Oscillospiraceae bacterium]